MIYKIRHTWVILCMRLRAKEFRSFKISFSQVFYRQTEEEKILLIAESSTSSLGKNASRDLSSKTHKNVQL